MYFATAQPGAIGDAVPVHYLSAAQRQSCQYHYDALPGALTTVAVEGALPGYLGVHATSDARGRLLLSEVQPDSPGSRAGLLPGDILTHVDGQPIGRLDVFPVDDLGIRKAIQRAYSYKRLPAPVTMHRHARKWIPYRTIATWYLWRSLDVAVTPFQETPDPE